MNINATILGQTISFVLFVWFCIKYVWFPLISIIEQRQKEISDSLEDARKSVIQSKKAHDEAIVYLKNARVEAQKIIEYAYACEKKILKEAKHKATYEYNMILSKAQDKIHQEKEKASNELRRSISKLVVIGIEKIIEQSIDNIDHNDIINSFIKRISSKKKEFLND